MPPASLAGFWALIAVQFQNAFSDNTLKWLVSFLVLEAGLTKEQRDLWFILVVPLLFAVPFLLFSIPGGYFADKYSKRNVALGTKFLELIVMGLATFAFARNRVDIAGVALFLACTQGAIFGPTKYALLPELLPESKLSWGNGIIELTTLLSAIFAALAGGFLATHFRGRQVWSGVFFLPHRHRPAHQPAHPPVAPRAIPPAASTGTYRANFWPNSAASGATTCFGRRPCQHVLLVPGLASAPEYRSLCHRHSSRRRRHSSYLLAALSLGIGVGSFIAGYASADKIEHGMVLPGMIGIIVMAATLSRPGLSFAAVAVLLALLGIAGGFFVVPVNALIQRRPAPEEKGRTIAVANLLSFVGVALQPLAQYAMLRLGHPDPSRVFLVAAVMTL